MIVGLLNDEISIVSGGDRLFNWIGNRQISGYELIWNSFKITAILGYCLYTWRTVPCVVKHPQSETTIDKDEKEEI